ncbi:MAG: 23S rRNA (guanosine(2251)-2'-O)-methyltransferase RlmB, partial [Candidatus Shikimatogenerans sp. JK-2022]|nr:23S rRNA (guanosine(2251)-2'-O)-methyltransferase RlmB [Candidatus Shikimatogenerans bostrichidophilus]
KKKILILYNITDTKNIGSIIRSSVCFNVDFIIISKNYYLYNQNIIKISSGAIFKIKICQVKNLINTINFLINNNIKIISITEKGDKNINELSLNKKESFAFILGNEETGIPNNILKISNYKIFIPINKKNITSLNVAIVCGIFLYEINKLL